MDLSEISYVVRIWLIEEAINVLGKNPKYLEMNLG